MLKEEIIFKANQLMFVSMATPVSDFETYIPVCDLPFTQKSVLPKGAVYEIGVWNDNHTKFMLLREFGKAIEVKEDDERFKFKNFADEYKNFKLSVTAQDLVDGILYDKISTENKILLRKNLQEYAAEKRAEKKGRSK